MKNILAVYTSKPSLKGSEFTAMAQEGCLEVRFLGLGGFILHNPEQDKSLADVRGGASLLVGALESDAAVLAEFDRLVSEGQRESIVAMLNGGQLPWCELYVGRFDYEKTVQKKPKDRAGIDGSVSKKDLPALKAARTRYIIDNQSRKKNCGSLMEKLAELIATARKGVIADYQRPKR